MHSSGSTGSRARLLSPDLWLALVLAAVCLWLLSLPVFPSQDGPMHRYYVHVLDSLLQHRSTYAAYQVRHPFPPYASHYGALLVLFHVLPYDWAEKVFACVVVLALGWGLRRSAQEAGPAGRWWALLSAPVLLGWPLMMGFFNFVLGVGLLLLCTAFWQSMGRSGQKALPAFVATLLLLMVTHPIPLLLLIVLCGLDLGLSLLRRAAAAPQGWWRRHRVQAAALLLTVLAALFPAMAVDRSQTSSTVQLIRFHPEFLRTSLLLAGVSPYNSRSLHPSINGYRLCLYALFAGAMWVGGKAALRAWRARQVNFATTVFAATVLLALALPFLPNLVNGSDYFSTRLVFLLWPAAIVAAGAAEAPGPRARGLFVAAAIACCALTLLAAQLFLRPAALQVHAAEGLSLPAGQRGALLLGADLDDYERFHAQLAFNPLKWAAILPFVRQDSVALDTPWLDLKIVPIAAAPGSPELGSDISLTRSGRTGAALVPGHSLPGDREAQLVQASGFMILAATPPELAQGLHSQLSADEAAKYTCGAPQDWYLLCTSGGR